MTEKYFAAHESSESVMTNGSLVATTGGGWWILTHEQMPENDDAADAKLIESALNAYTKIKSSPSQEVSKAQERKTDTTSKYDKIRNEPVIELISNLFDIAKECPDKDTSEKLINALAEYNEKRWATSDDIVE